jgi:hypothetical protein
MIADILASFVMPHFIAFFFLLRIAMWEERPSGTFREDVARLWAWSCPHWRTMVAHPLYWAVTGVVTAYFLVGVFL